MALVSPLEATILRYRCGKPLQLSKALRTRAIQGGCARSPGLLLVSTLHRPAIVRCMYGTFRKDVVYSASAGAMDVSVPVTGRAAICFHGIVTGEVRSRKCIASL